VHAFWTEVRRQACVFGTFSRISLTSLTEKLAMTQSDCSHDNAAQLNVRDERVNFVPEVRNCDRRHHTTHLLQIQRKLNPLFFVSTWRLISPLWRIRPSRVSFYQLAAHRILTPSSLYRGLMTYVAHGSTLHALRLIQCQSRSSSAYE
jgi:hypothetical protein